MIDIETNTFYKKQLVTTTVPLISEFPDLPLSGGSDPDNIYYKNYHTYTTGDFNSLVVMSGNTTSDITYGDYKLEGGYLRTFVDGSDAEFTSTPPNVLAYNMNGDYELKEGTFTLAQTNQTGKTMGGSLAIYQSMDTGITTNAVETFDDMAVMTESVEQIGQFLYEGPYILLSELEDNYTSWVPYNQTEKLVENARKAAINFEGQQIVPLLKTKDAEIDDYKILQTNYQGQAIGVLNASGITTSAARSINKNSGPGRRIIDKIKFMEKRAVEKTADDETPLSITTSPLISDYFVSKTIQNPFSADLANPLIYSTVGITKEGEGINGNALRMYHEWDYSDSNRAYETSDLGGATDISPQVAMVGVYDIPMPLITDVAAATRIGDKRTTLPSIDIDMNIVRLGPTPLYGCNAFKTTYCSGTGGGTVNEITVMARGRAQPIESYFHDTGGYDNADEAESFLRSVTICFSNYKPLESHKKLDDFLNYGLNNFYYGDGAGEDYVQGIVGGVTFRNFGMLSSNYDATTLTYLPGGYENNAVYAQALPVCQNIDLLAARSTGGADVNMSLYVSGGLAAFEPGAVFPSTAANTYQKETRVSGSLSVMATGRTRNINTNQVALLGPSPQLSPKTIKLPMNSSFNMKFFMDVVQSIGNTTNSLNPYFGWPAASNNNGKGSFMRVMFDTHEPQEILGLTGTAPDDQNENLPYLDIPFPAPLNDHAASDAYTMRDNNNARFPKYMTIWVQNYRWIKGTEGNQGSRESGSPADLHFKYGDIGVSGASMQTEVLIDSISLNNFYPTTQNATATNQKVGSIGLVNNSVMSPFKTLNTGDYWAGGYSDDYTNLVTQGSYEEVAPGNYISIGFNGKDELPISGTYEAGGYMLFNNFSSASEATLDRIVDSTGFLGSGAYLSVSPTLSGNFVTGVPDYNGAGQMFTGFSATGSTVNTAGTGYNDPLTKGRGRFDVTGGAAADNKFCYASGSNTMFSTDGFAQKGFAYLNVKSASATATATGSWSTWGRRENPLASTKITAISATDDLLDSNQVRVADVSVINGANRDWTGETGFTNNGSYWEDEQYIIYRPNTLIPNSDTYANATGSKTALKIVNIQNDIITFDQSVEKANNSSIDLCTPDLLNELYISPWKYWISLLFKTDQNIVPRNYGQVAMVNETPSDSNLNQLGTTWNESLYNYYTGLETKTFGGRSSPYNRRWALNMNDDSALDLTTDYGHGAYDIETKRGGYIDKKTAVSGAYLDINLKGLISSGKVKDGQDFVIATVLEDPLTSNLVKIVSENATNLYLSGSASTSDVAYYQPRYYWKYRDEVPKKPSLTMTANSNLVDGSANLYDLTSENLNSIKFDWNESDDDIWYRYMIVSTGSIENKYSHAQLWIPLNDIPANQDLGVYSTYTGYNVVSGTTHTLSNGGGLTSDITGFSGWAPVFKGATDEYLKLPSGSASPVYPNITGSKFSLVAHCVPDANTEQKTYIIQKGLSASGVGMLISGADNNAPMVQINHSGTMLTSYTINLEQPLNVIYTYEKDCADGLDGKLYVNGVLADTQATLSTPSTTNKDLTIGADSSNANRFRGTIEEIIFYDTVLKVPETANTYTLNTADYEDLSGSDIITHTARLFTFDYHNIRGKSQREVASSNQLSWRATTL